MQKFDKTTGRFLKKYESILTYDFLFDNYITKKLTTLEISKLVNIHQSVIVIYLRYNKIKARNSSEHLTYNFTKEFLVEEYKIKNKSARQIAREQKCEKGTIIRFLKLYKIRQKSRSKLVSNFFKAHPEKVAVKKGTKRDPKIGKKVSKSKMGFKFSEESKKKMSEAQKGEKSHMWRGGVSFLPYPPTWTSELEVEIRDRDNHECQNCGMTEEEHLIVYGFNLDVHHIDSDKMNCDKNNLISLCKHCHTRSRFNRDYWIKVYQDKLNKGKILSTTEDKKSK